VRIILAFTFLIVFGVIALLISQNGAPLGQQPIAVTRLPERSAVQNTPQVAGPQPVTGNRARTDTVPAAVNTERGAPLFGPRYDATDGRPVYTCAMPSFSTYLTLVQMQASGIDIANGFHLAIVPYELDATNYEFEQFEVENHLRTGQWDCEFSTVDAVARSDYAVITAVIDESAGGDGIYAHNLSSIYSLRGKVIAYESESSAEFYLRYVLFIAGMSDGDVTLLPFDGVEDAVQAFVAGQADAVSAYDPYFEQARSAGGRPLLMSDKLRVIIDVVLTSRESIARRPDVVQAFHNAWFDALKLQYEDPAAAATAIAAWGHNAWTGISTETAHDDLRGHLARAAQADLRQNSMLFDAPDPLFVTQASARELYGLPPLDAGRMRALIDARFVRAASQSGRRSTTARPVNNTFSLAGGAEIPVQTMLPCRRFTFQPNTSDLTTISQRILDLCVLPALRQRPSARLLIIGSAAWPGPEGAFTAAEIEGFATSRARAVFDYLSANGIAQERMRIQSVLPPEGRRNTADEALQAEDRFVEMTLEFGGW
jgi:outer membrane protein OmpA-like peptidoglycan-associated protein